MRLSCTVLCLVTRSLTEHLGKSHLLLSSHQITRKAGGQELQLWFSNQITKLGTGVGGRNFPFRNQATHSDCGEAVASPF